jgi:hypothetical protein
MMARKNAAQALHAISEQIDEVEPIKLLLLYFSLPL